MSLAAGSRLGPYEVKSPLGAGGMGEVYQARDTRLGRDVAMKVLPAEIATDAGRLRRFEKEARAASALNHPNIVTIYDIGSADSVSWIAMERVEGKTLREILHSGPLPTRRLLAAAAQIADGLARAHEAGIVHRDLKPENVMVTRDGLVKILDFGLAKQTGPVSGSDEGSHLPTETGTSPGVVLGTVGYMSPEQASGQLVDFRSDQFSFGSILYEMATGKRAFHKGTAIDTLSAILHEDPKPLEQVNPEAPAPLRWIVERCLAKDPEERYGATRDLARDLATMRDHLSEATSSAAEAGVGTPRARWWIAAALAVAVAAIAAASLFVGKSLGRTPLPKFQQVTFQRGAIQTARFAPDGQTVLYGLTRGGPSELFSTRIGSPEYRLLGLPPADILSVSSTGELAVLFGPRVSGTLARAPLAGGAPREVLENVNSAGWSPDGKDLAVVRPVGGKWRLEFPIGKTIYESPDSLYGPSFSPKGGLIAVGASGFLASPSAGSRMIVLGVDGKVRAELQNRFRGKAWSPSGKELWLFESPSESSTEVRAMSFDGRERLVARLPGTFVLQDIAADGRLLTERVSETSEMAGLGAGESSERNLTWLDRSVPADVSADGKKVLFSDRGAVYLRGLDGSPAKRLGQGLARALSADGNWALAFREGQPMEAVLLPTGAGEVRKLSIGTVVLGPTRGGVFFPDGKRVLIEGSEPGHGNRLYVLDLAGGPPRAVTPEGVELSDGVQTVSPDGKFVAARGTENRAWLYALDAGSASQPRPVPGASPGEIAVRWSSDGKSLFFLDFILDVESGRRRPWNIFHLPDPAIDSVSSVVPAADGRSYVYSYQRYKSELFLIEGLK